MMGLVLAPLAILYFFGGYLWGLFLFVQLFLSKRLLAWTLPFAFGAILLGATILFTLFDQYVVRPVDYRMAHELVGWSIGGVFIPPLFWWISAVIFCYYAYYKKHFASPIYQSQSIEMPLPPDEQGK